MSLLRDLYALGEELASDPDRDFLPVGYERKPVAFVVSVSTKGAPLRVVDTRSPDDRRGVVRAVPFQKRSGQAAPPNLLCDNLQYVGAFAKDESERSAAKAAEVQRTWIALLRRAADEVAGESGEQLRVVADALADPEALRAAMAEARIELPEKPGDASGLLCAFLVDGADPTARADLRDWWAAQVSADAAGPEGLCQVTGRVGPLARKFDAIKLPGNQPTLISANFEAAERYSASQSTGANISVAAAKQSHAALNWLLDSDAHSSRLGEATLVWWIQGSADDDILASLIDDPAPDQVRELLNGMWGGHPVPLDDASQFRAVLLTVSTARVVVRSDQTVALGRVVRSLGNYFQWQGIRLGADRVRYYPLRRLAESATRVGRQGAQMAHVNRLQADLLACAIAGKPVPKHYLGAVLNRCRAERSVPDQRAALISLILRSQQGGSSVEHTDAFVSGQIFAQYEYLQYRALGKVNRTISDTYFASAMTHPARVIPALESKARHHLAKLRRDSAGAFVAVSKDLARLNSELVTGYPASLSLEQQSEFVLGYHTARNAHFNAGTAEETTA